MLDIDSAVTTFMEGYRSVTLRGEEPNSAGLWKGLEAVLAQSEKTSDATESFIVGSRWRHWNGSVYTIKMLANTSNPSYEYPVTIVYEGENGKIWAHKASEWMRSFTLLPNGPHILTAQNGETARCYGDPRYCEFCAKGRPAS